MQQGVIGYDNSGQSLVLDAKENGGANGFGLVDESATLQAWLDSCISAGDPVTTTRQGIATAWLSEGTYRVDTPLRVKSVIDFHLSGPGRLVPGVPGMECLLDINGVAYSTFKGLSFAGSAGNSCTRALWLRWNGVNRSTAWNSFEDLTVRDLLYTRAAFEIGDTANPGVQVDTDTWKNCLALGDRTAGGGDVTNYQSGFRVGEGTSANNLIHRFEGCSSYHNRWGVYNDASQVAWNGNMLQANDVDIFHVGRGYTSVKEVRSEGSLRLLETAGPASYPMSISLEEIDWHCNALHADQYFIKHSAGGTLRLANVHLPYLAAKNPAISVNSPVDLTIVVDGVSSPTPWTWPFIDDTGGAGKARVAVSGYAQINSSGDVSAVQKPGAVNGLLIKMLDAIPTDSAIEVKSAADTVVAKTTISNTLSQFALGSADTDDAENRVRGGSAGYYFDRKDGTQEWLIYRTGAGVSGVYLRDVVNARMHVTFWPGTTNDNAQSEFASEVRILGPLNHDGTAVGFYGAAPVTQPVANPDTSGATLANLEIEVNQLKALLRSLGLMAP